jgi:hypothetical protein
MDALRVTKPNELPNSVSQEIARRNLFTSELALVSTDAYGAPELALIPPRQKIEIAVKRQGPISVEDMGKSHLVYAPFLFLY